MVAGEAELGQLSRGTAEPGGALALSSPRLLEHGLAGLRAVVLDVADAGLRAAAPGPAADRLLRRDNGLLIAGGRSFDLRRARSVVVLGAGKASLAIAAALEGALGDDITRGLVVARRGTASPLRRIEVRYADHPVPSEASLGAGRALTAIAGQLGPGDLLITAFTGGSSALACLPPDGVPFAAKRQLHEMLLRSGAPVSDVNAVRKHVSDIKGGRLAELAGGAAILNLTVSDVVGDHLDLLCDPAVPDSSTAAEAIAVLRRYGLWAQVPAPVRAHLSGPASESPSLAGRDITSVVLVAGARVTERMERRVRELGWQPVVLGSELEGEAASLGGFLGTLAAGSSAAGRPFPAGTVLLAAGSEATVTLPAAELEGRGGPNQELALAFARAAGRSASSVAGAFLDSDGADGGTDAAGGCVDSTTAARAAAARLSLDDAIAGHQSTGALRQLQDLIVTGPTGTNVSDLWVIAIGPAASAAGGAQL